MIDPVLSRRKILITCGTGGVGKTTVSAALAIRAALQGKNAVVITIDPAKRLATSLGLKTLGDDATDLTRLLGRECKGKFSAIIPDTRRTFENFVETLAPNREVAQRITRNPIFQIFAKEFSGTNEYMALERLYALHALDQYDCIVLDTPPSRNTLAFLDAPGLLARFFDEKLIKWLVLPANKIFSGGMRKALGVLERLTGSSFMSHLFDFASALFEVQASFSANLRKITELLRSEQVGFLLVAAPAPDLAPESRYFVRSVREHRFRFDGVILNRTLGHLEFPSVTPPGLEASFKVLKALQIREARAIEKLQPETQTLARLPELGRDVHSVEDLLYVAETFN